MQPLTNHVSPADRAAKLFLHGANLGNYLEVPPGQNWGVTFSADELTAMKREGFDHVRVPIGWQHYAGPAPGLERRFSILKSGGKPRADGNARRAF